MAITDDPPGTASVGEADDVILLPVADVLPSPTTVESPPQHTGPAYGCPVCAAAANQ